MVDRGRDGNTKKGNLTPPQQGRKQMTSLLNHVLYISCPSAMSFLISFVASFVFNILESSLNWFFTLTYIRETKEWRPEQSDTFLGWAKAKARVYKMICFFHRASFAIACWLFWLSCQDATWPAFVKYRLGKQLINKSVQDNRLWEVNRGNSCISGIHWLYFELVAVDKNSSVVIEAQNWIDGRSLWSQDL